MLKITIKNTGKMDLNKINVNIGMCKIWKFPML